MGVHDAYMSLVSKGLTVNVKGFRSDNIVTAHRLIGD